MTAIEASSTRCKTLADGTLQITVSVEPRDAVRAFTLFGSPGTTMAIAALKGEAKDAEQPPKKAKGGELSKWAALRCAMPTFQTWLASTFPDAWRFAHGDTQAEKAAGVIRGVCCIESRAELDHDSRARVVFDREIRGPWQKHYTTT